MRSALRRCALALTLTLVCDACSAPPPALTAPAGGVRVPVDPTFPLLYRIDPAWDRGTRLALPGYGYNYDYDYGRRAPLAARPPGWADDLPRRARASDRFLRPDRHVVCDRATSICYKRGEVDKSATEGVFGERAGDRADDLRDKLGTARLFVPERGVACDRGRRACFDDGEPDRRLTRRYFGRRGHDLHQGRQELSRRRGQAGRSEQGLAQRRRNPQGRAGRS